MGVVNKNWPDWRTSETLNEYLREYDLTAEEEAAGIGFNDIVAGYMPGDVRRYGIAADGTDQSASLVTFFGTTLPSTYEGVFFAPAGVRFKPESVVPEIPLGCILKCEGATVSYDTAGETNKFYGIMSQDSPPNDTHFGIVSDHHPTLMTNNLGGAAGVIAANHGQSWVQCAGYLDQGAQSQQGYRPMAIFQWAKDNAGAYWKYAMRRIAPHVAIEYELWAQGRVYAAGDYVLSDSKIYSTAAGGTAGATAPTHTSGSVSDGAVTWTFHSVSDVTVWSVDEEGRVKYNGGVSEAHLFSAIQNALDSATNAIVSFAAQDGSTSRDVTLKLIPTNGSGTLTQVPQLKAIEANGLLVRNSGDNDTIATITDGAFVFGKPVGWLSYSATDLGDQTAEPNTTNKAAGRVVRDSTNNRLLMASGSGATATWDNIADGTTVITPS